ncbi:type II toxin-antitoxin system VapC family toxin [Nocardia brasiliensis]|uniref:type II toxin-antitoxin system VapC family toxin n=1 Tax=Nocardia brasiliensis TaxID=37326 RepID=UPI002454A950|nr:type II toxin-antitoxin system VapC family toxin [Nocardia brasiliensis]
MTATGVEPAGYLLDTNAVSEWIKPRPDPALMTWLHDEDEDRMFLSVITIGEIRRGVDRMSDGRRKVRLTTWLSDEVVDRFDKRLLPVDLGVSQAWGRIRARAEAVGRRVDPIDALIAATAEAHGLAVVTRNRKDFRGAGVPLVCPWGE